MHQDEEPNRFDVADDAMDIALAALLRGGLAALAEDLAWLREQKLHPALIAEVERIYLSQPATSLVQRVL